MRSPARRPEEPVASTQESGVRARRSDDRPRKIDDFGIESLRLQVFQTKGPTVPEGKRIPENSLVIGVPGRIVRQTTNEERERIKRTVDAYLDLSEQYRKGRWK